MTPQQHAQTRVATPSQNPMHNLLQIGSFPAAAQALIDTEFRCYSLQQLDQDPALRQSVQGIITRGNYAVPRDVMARLPALRVVSTCGVGYDQVALDAAAERGILVANTPGVLNAAVAELCVGLILALLRRLPQADHFVRSGAWRSGSVFPLASSLAGKQVGIVGLGRIGKDIARRLEAFDVGLAYHGRSDQQLQWPFEPDLQALARRSDVLILIAPGGPTTAGMINADVLEALGPRGVLINVARGSVVDEEALIQALQQGRIAGAALDVFAREPEVDPRLLALDNVLLTPHIGSATHETRLAMARLTLDNLHQFFRDGSVITPVPLG
jgi:lactate dehydrogenase-like 2-hydroxyacid dehydrogenase